MPRAIRGLPFLKKNVDQNNSQFILKSSSEKLTPEIPTLLKMAHPWCLFQPVPVQQVLSLFRQTISHRQEAIFALFCEGQLYFWLPVNIRNVGIGTAASAQNSSCAYCKMTVQIV